MKYTLTIWLDWNSESPAGAQEEAQDILQNLALPPWLKEANPTMDYELAVATKQALMAEEIHA